MGPTDPVGVLEARVTYGIVSVVRRGAQVRLVVERQEAWMGLHEARELAEALLAAADAAEEVADGE